MANRFVETSGYEKGMLSASVLVGLADVAFYSLSDAVKFSVDRHPELAKMNFTGQVFLALEHYSSMSVKDRDTLTRDEVGAINFYSQESPFYRILNRSLSARNIEHFLPYMKLLLRGLHKCPLGKYPRTYYRVINKDMLDAYPVGRTVCWWQFTSTTDNLGAAAAFCGTGDHTLFAIETRCVVSIKKFSAMPLEDEFILLPVTYLKVKATMEESKMVQLEEKPSPPLIDFAHPEVRP
jgi:NAD:arginine ADP-ribosyltransferase